MTKDDIIAKTNDVFEQDFEMARERLVPTAHIFNDLGLDSLDTVDLVVALQKKFGVRIRDEEQVKNIRTLEDVYDFILRVKNQQEAGGDRQGP